MLINISSNQPLHGVNQLFLSFLATFNSLKRWMRSLFFLLFFIWLNGFRQVYISKKYVVDRFEYWKCFKTSFLQLWTLAYMWSMILGGNHAVQIGFWLCSDFVNRIRNIDEYMLFDYHVNISKSVDKMKVILFSRFVLS